MDSPTRTHTPKIIAAAVAAIFALAAAVAAAGIWALPLLVVLAVAARPLWRLLPLASTATVRAHADGASLRYVEDGRDLGLDRLASTWLGLGRTVDAVTYTLEGGRPVVVFRWVEGDNPHARNVRRFTCLVTPTAADGHALWLPAAGPDERMRGEQLGPALWQPNDVVPFTVWADEAAQPLLGYRPLVAHLANNARGMRIEWFSSMLLVAMPWPGDVEMVGVEPGIVARYATLAAPVDKFDEYVKATTNTF